MSQMGRERQFDPAPATAAIRLLRTPERANQRTADGRSRPVKGNDDLTLAADQLCVTIHYLVGVTFSPARARRQISVVFSNCVPYQSSFFA
jgi:hypothetical protein